MKMPNQTTTRRNPELTQRGVEGAWGPPTLLNVNVEIALEFMHSLTLIRVFIPAFAKKLTWRIEIVLLWFSK